MSENKNYNGKKGGYLKGKSHSAGGIKGIVTDTLQPIEVEGGEIIINKAASKLHCEELSQINQSAGGGVAINCDKTEVREVYKNGGQLDFFSEPEPVNITNAILSALKVQLKYEQNPAAKATIQEQIAIHQQNELNPKEIKDAIDFALKKLEALTDVNTLLNVNDSSINTQRTTLLNWIKAPENNVKVLIAFSGGKDSVAMVLKALFIDKIPPEQIELHHHKVDGDTEDYIWDWACTDSYCQAFAKHFNIPILFSFSEGGITKTIFRENEPRQDMFWQDEENGAYKSRPALKIKKTQLKFPAVQNDLDKRWCSSVAKIEVMSAMLNNSIKFSKDANIVVFTGERRLESKNRAKYNEIEVMKNTAPTLNRNVLVWRSVIDYTENTIWDMYEKHKIQPHPCYVLGWSRCSCQLCIFNADDTWASANDISPSKVAKIADIEKKLKEKNSPLPSLYNAYERVPFDPPQFIKSGKNQGKEKLTNGRKLENIYEAKVNKGKSFVTPENKKRWAYEANNKFVSPIIVDTWERPVGADSILNCGAN